MANDARKFRYRGVSPQLETLTALIESWAKFLRMHRTEEDLAYADSIADFESIEIAKDGDQEFVVRGILNRLGYSLCADAIAFELSELADHSSDEMLRMAEAGSSIEQCAVDCRFPAADFLCNCAFIASALGIPTGKPQTPETEPKNAQVAQAEQIS